MIQNILQYPVCNRLSNKRPNIVNKFSILIKLFLLFYRLWDIECGACLRVLEGHEELVRCIRFDSKRIVSGAYDG